MNYPPIKVRKLFEDVQLPERAFPTDSGLDVFVYCFYKLFNIKNEYSLVNPKLDEITLCPSERVLINTGIAATVGEGYEIQVRPRSGLALNKGLTVLNTPGTIDERYRGMVGVVIINTSGIPVVIKKGYKIAQIVVAPVILSEVEVVEDLGETDRGEGGFGSTGGKA